MSIDKTEILDKVLEALESGSDTSGFCLACGAETDGVEPDARKYKCDSCGQLKVYGAEEIVLMLG